MKKLITPHDAYVVQGARLISEPVLSEILKDLSLTRQERILAFLYIYHFITKEQCMRLCHSCILPNTSLGNTLRRMCESGLVTPCVNNEKDISGKNIYRIRKKGIFAGETLFRSKLIELLNKEGTFSYFFKFICGNNGVTIDECLRYLSDRCINFMNRTSSAHTLGVNDVTLALLPDRSYNPPVLYTREREAFCDKSGMFVSIYEKTYRNLNLKSGAVRCDALLNFYFLSDRATLEVCIEQDTGSQHPAVITEKIEKYFDHIFRARLKNSSTSSRLPLLIFTISENKEIPSEDRQRLTGTDNLNPRVMYLAQGIEMIGSIYRAEKNVTYLSLYELSAYVEDLLMPLTEKKRILSFLDECIAKVGGQTEIYNLRTALGIKVKNAPLGKQALYDFYANKHYYSRRNMILKAVDKIPKAIDLMYHGASLCTVSSRHAKAIRTLVPSLCGLPEAIGCAANTTISSYTPLTCLPCGGIKDADGNVCNVAVRNVYTLSDGRKIAVENIGDDYGAYVRVKRFLEVNSVPCDIICFFNRNEESSIRNFLSGYKDSSVIKRFHIVTYNCVQAEEEENGHYYIYDVIETSSLINIGTFLG